MKKIQILAILNRLVRDGEDATKITFECDSQQIDIVNKIPAQQVLRLTIEGE